MHFFNFDDTKTPTKIYVSELCEPVAAAEREISTRKSMTGSAIAAASSILVKIAPDLIDKGVKFFSSAIASFAEDQVTQTYVYKNIDARSKDKVFLPNKITIIRANFLAKIDENSEKEIFGDGDNKQYNRVQLATDNDKELQIEIEVVPSQAKNAVCFQPKSYFYKGEDIEGNDIDEIIITFSFVPAGHTALAYDELTFQSLLHFRQLENGQFYSFESDTSYQSPWLIPRIDNHEGPYTLVIGIQEIRKGNSFAGLIHDIYAKHKDEVIKELAEQVTQALQKKP